ncbi:HAD-IA family hydrolase [Polycladidibacter hongkongensis]|uniref:HAD-IA family hydrolase n=1 Tax=Polycladidibacter hongkongensis TaxID=1647556 RepID=UPI0008334638|nr:HAD-IA family hydrolase [Pseudovibrio hongkongensis]
MYLVLFDCDGTLVDSQDSIMYGLRAAFAALDLPQPTRAQGLSIVGLSLDEAFLQLVGEERADIVPAMSDAYRKAAIARRTRGEDLSPLYPGAKAALEVLSTRDDVLMGVATGKHSRGVAHMVTEHGLEGKFLTVQTADRAPSKPHPAMIQQAMDELCVTSENVVMIGDTTYDMQMARNAGVAGLGVNWGYHERDALLQAGAFKVLEQFDALLPALSEKFGW